MKLFTVVLELISHYQSGPKAIKNETFTSKARISFPALDEIDAREMIEENFGERMVRDQQYKLDCEGEAEPKASGFAIMPISDEPASD